MPLGSYMTASAEDAPIVFSTFNISGVTEGSAASPTFTPESDIEVFSIMTYHWNHGSGSPARTGQLAMAYVPFQQWGDTMEADKALPCGTLFSDLVFPFERGGSQ